ncbi:MAG: hypothetical protein ACOX5Z_03160 [Desulfobulbus sp.]|jgi:hypothetical protein
MFTDKAHLLTRLYEGTPLEKWHIARMLHQQLGTAHPGLPVQVGRELDRLREHCLSLSAHMRALAMHRLCAHCAARPGGGCCSALMADNSDVPQILINMLLNHPVAAPTENGTECGFLGPEGCRFLVKPIFCLNYNCTHIVHATSPSALRELEARAAAVLGSQTRIETALLEMLRAGL